MTKTRKWGQTDVVTVGQGTWQMEGDDRRRCIEALQVGLDAGMTHIDTAELYGSGRVESLVGEAIRGRREEVFLVSKVLPSNASASGTKKACEASLKRLGTDRLDCYLLHWPGSHPLEETIGAFEALRAEGKIRSWGVSNFDEDDLANALRIAGEGRIACNQVLYHLKQRAIEHAVIPFCRVHDIALVAYSPFGSGDFPARNAVLERIARTHSASAHQVALAFLLREPGSFVIPKTADPDHARSNARAMDLELTNDDIAAIDEAFPRGRARGLPTL